MNKEIIRYCASADKPRFTSQGSDRLGVIMSRRLSGDTCTLMTVHCSLSTARVKRTTDAESLVAIKNPYAVIITLMDAEDQEYLIR